MRILQFIFFLVCLCSAVFAQDTGTVERKSNYGVLSVSSIKPNQASRSSEFGKLQIASPFLNCIYGIGLPVVLEMPPVGTAYVSALSSGGKILVAPSGKSPFTIEGISEKGIIKIGKVGDPLPAPLVFSPENIDFGIQKQSAYTEKTITLTNLSDSLIKILAVSKTDISNGSYFVVGTKLEGMELEPASHINLQILHYPTVLGINQAIINIVTNQGEFSFSVQSNCVEEESLPDFPKYINAQAVSQNQISLNWEKLNESLTYILYRGTTDGIMSNMQEIYRGPFPGYQDGKGLTPNTNYFYRVKTENSMGLSDFSDQAETKTLPVGHQPQLPELVAYGLVPESEYWLAGQEQKLNIFIRNNGKKPSVNFKAQLYLSKTSNINNRDIALGQPLIFEALEAGGDINRTVSVVIPEIAEGYYWPCIVVDPENQVAGKVKNAGSGFSRKLVKVLPKRVSEKSELFGRFEVYQQEVIQGNLLNVGITINNYGLTAAERFSYSFGLTKSYHGNTDQDIELGRWISGTVPGNNGYLTFSQSVLVSEDIQSGDYYLYLKTDVDDEIEEATKANNLEVSDIPIKVLKSDNVKTVSGYVYEINKVNKLNNWIIGGVGVANVTILGLPKQVKTDNEGRFEADVPFGWNGTIWLLKDNYTFHCFNGDGASYRVEKVTENVRIDAAGVNVKDVANKIIKMGKFLTQESVYDLQKLIIGKKHSVNLGKYSESGLETVNDAFEVAGQTLYAVNEISDLLELYDARYSEYDNINYAIKAFKLMRKVSDFVGLPGLSKIIGAYFEIGEEALVEVEKIMDAVAMRAFPRKSLQLKVQLDGFDKTFEASDLLVNGETPWLKIYWLVGGKNNRGIPKEYPFELKLIETNGKYLIYNTSAAWLTHFNDLLPNELFQMVKIEIISNDAEPRTFYAPLEGTKLVKKESVNVGEYMEYSLKLRNYSNFFQEKYIKAISLKEYNK